MNYIDIYNRFRPQQRNDQSPTLSKSIKRDLEIDLEIQPDKPSPTHKSQKKVWKLLATILNKRIFKLKSKSN